MKHWLISFCLLWSVAFVAAAQEPAKTAGADSDEAPAFTTPKSTSWLGKFERHQTKMVTYLQLTDTQRRSLDTVNDQYVTQRAALYEDKALDRHDRKGKLHDLRQSRETRFQTMLNAEQLEKWNDLRKGKKKQIFRKK